MEFLSSIVFNLVATAEGYVACLFAMAISAALDSLHLCVYTEGRLPVCAQTAMLSLH